MSVRPSAEESALEILRRAESLEVPWERILLDEIQAERGLRRHAPYSNAEIPLATALTLLPFSFLKSWRVRDQIQSLSCEACGASSRGAVSDLRMVFRRLIGQPDSGQAAFAGHLWIAYQRVLLLQRVCQTARKSRGTNRERLAFIRSNTGCSDDDAAWAICREDSPRSGQSLDAAVRKARDEGFQIPRAPTELLSLARLRRIVRSSRRSSPRRPSPELSRNPVSLPRRLSLPADAI